MVKASTALVIQGDGRVLLHSWDSSNGCLISSACRHHLNAPLFPRFGWSFLEHPRVEMSYGDGLVVVFFHCFPV